MGSLLFKMATLIQYPMHCVSAKKCLANWNICAVNPPTLMFGILQVTSLYSSDYGIEQMPMFVGKSKLDRKSEVDQI